ncbi:Uncharacterised protein [uncultured archaeon]|nr:Uncharacterised protein [uncultured archaeon]
MKKWLSFKIFSVVALGFLFSLGMLLIDYGASLKGTDGYGQSLAFERVDPRIMYHEGIIFVLGSFLCMTVLAAHELTSLVSDAGVSKKGS